MEQHEFQFRGVWLPADVMKLLEEGTINAKAVVLLAMVDALVSPKRGCYASNAYLGKRIGSSAETVRRLLAQLEELGLVVRTLRNGFRREIETAWSRQGVHKSVEGPPQSCAADTKAKQSKAGGARRGDEDMPFIEPTEPRNGHPATEQDEEFVTTLLGAVRTKLPGKKANRKTWARSFATLRRSVGAERIQKALTWYVHNIGKPYVPQAYAATSFKEKFAAIEAAMQRDPDVGTATEITPQAAEIARRLAGRHWPKGSGDDVPAVVQGCLDRYTEFIAHRDAFMKGMATGEIEIGSNTYRDRLIRFGKHLRGAMPAPAAFVEQWMIHLNDRVAGWDGWSGNLSSMAFHRRSKEFTKRGREWATRFCGNPARWDQFVEGMEDADTEEG